MTERAEETRADGLVPDLDDLLQCPVCYEIPDGQIFQCNEGHHVCGRCKLRLDVCPVCRAFFFGTRNYAMEELIANVKRLQAFKLGGKVTTGNTTPEQTVEVKESTSEENTSTNNNEDEDDTSSRTSMDPPRPCSGLFRCLCCKTNPERLPAARLLNHLRYFHSPELIEGRSENGEYVQVWQFSTEPGRIAAAIRIGDMGLFFLVIEITNDSVYAWLVMAASPRVAEEFSYTFILSGNDREAIFTDCVWSVRTCEGFLKKRQRCLSVSGGDARALLAPATMNAKLSLRRMPNELLPLQVQPRAILRVANRSNPRDAATPSEVVSQDLEPFLQDLQNDVARLSRAFATLGREANALVRSEAEMRARLENTHGGGGAPPAATPPVAAPRPPPEVRPEPAEPAPLSRNARRRMRQRLREAFRETQTGNSSATVAAETPRVLDQLAATSAGRAPPPNSSNYVARPNAAQNNNRVQNELTPTVAGRANQTGGRNVTATVQGNATDPPRIQNRGDRANNNRPNDTPRVNNNPPQLNPVHTVYSGLAIVVEQPVAPPPVGGSSGTGNNNSRNKKKRRQRR